MLLLSFDIGTKNSAYIKYEYEKFSFGEFSASNAKQLLNNLNKINYDRQIENKFCVIEKQMHVNKKACKIEHMIEMWATMNNFKVKLYPARNKYIHLNDSSINSKYKRKKWASKIVKNFIQSQGLLEKYEKLKKKDDIADAFLIALNELGIDYYSESKSYSSTIPPTSPSSSLGL